MVEANTSPELEALSSVSDTDDLPSADPQIDKYNGAAKGPNGRFVSTKPKLETPTTDTPPVSPPEPLPEPETVNEPVPAPQAQPKLSPVLQAMADRLGIPRHMLQGDPAQLRADIELAYKLAQQQGQVPQAKAADPEDDLDLGIADDEFDPKIVAALNKLKNKTLESRKENKQLREQNQQFFQQQEQYRKQQEIAQFEALCAKNPEVFGAGSYNELQPNSVEATRRAMLHQQIAMYYQDRPWANLDQAFQHFSQVFGVAAKPVASKTPPANIPSPNNRITPEQWNGAGLLPASQRNGTEKPLSRYERLVRDEAARQNANGHAALIAGFDDNSDLPKAPR